MSLICFSPPTAVGIFKQHPCKNEINYTDAVETPYQDYGK